MVPDSFGKFKNTLTLPKSARLVCADCNQYFGDYVELYLGRDSWEGWLRIKYGIKSPGQFKPFYDKRCVFRLEEQGDLKGAIVRPVYDDTRDDITILPVPQIGLLRRNSPERQFIKIQDVSSLAELERQGFETDVSTWILIYNPKDKSQNLTSLLGVLREKGIQLEADGHANPFIQSGLRKINARSMIDKIILRSIAKIAFNYMAKTQPAGFPLNDDFSKIRSFIRYGEGKSSDYVQFRPKPLLSSRGLLVHERAVGHIVTLRWDSSKTAIFSYVSLFNETNYMVRLCSVFHGLYREIASAHFYDLQRGSVSRMNEPNIIIP